MSSSGKYLYVVDLGRREIKVGVASDPKQRIKTYGYNACATNKPFISAKIEDYRECERRVCYLLRDKIHRGREFFKCDFSHVIGIVNSVLYDLENGGWPKEDPLETENVTFRELDTGTKGLIYEAAIQRGYDTSRQLFVAWVAGLENAQLKGGGNAEAD